MAQPTRWQQPLEHDLKQNLLAGLKHFEKVRILVVGDAMLDRYWYGDVERISPEAPVPIVAVGKSEERLGGSANVAQNITALGATCALLSVVGEDEAGEHLQILLRQQGIGGELIRGPRTGTTTKLRVLSRNQQLLRLDFDHQPEAAALQVLLQAFEDRLPEVDAVIFSDYGKGNLRDIQAMLQRAGEQGVPTLVDPKGTDYERYRGASVVTPNRLEFTQVAGSWSSEEELEQKAFACQAAYGVQSILLTRSEQGMSLFQSGQASLHQIARAREVFDVSGAGDTVIGAFGLALAAGLGPEHALYLANVAGGIVVGKLGAATVSREELLHELNHEED